MIRLSVHAHTMALERKIEIGWIEATVTSPDWVENDVDPALTRSFKAIAQFGARVLRVVHRPDNDDVLVVTAYFDRGAQR